MALGCIDYAIPVRVSVPPVIASFKFDPFAVAIAAQVRRWPALHPPEPLTTKPYFTRDRSHARELLTAKATGFICRFKRGHACLEWGLREYHEGNFEAALIIAGLLCAEKDFIGCHYYRSWSPRKLAAAADTCRWGDKHGCENFRWLSRGPIRKEGIPNIFEFSTYRKRELTTANAVRAPDSRAAKPRRPVVP